MDRLVASVSGIPAEVRICLFVVIYAAIRRRVWAVAQRLHKEEGWLEAGSFRDHLSEIVGEWQME